MSQGTLPDTLIRLEDFIKIFVFLQKIDFFPRGKSRVFGRKWPQGSRSVGKVTQESFLNANNSLTKNFLFNSHPEFIFLGLILCPWSLGSPKKCLVLSVFGHTESMESFKRIFVFRPKIDFFPRSKSMVIGHKRPNFEVGIFHLGNQF